MQSADAANVGEQRASPSYSGPSEESFARFYRAKFRLMLGLSLKYLPLEDAEENVQDAFFRAYRGLPEFRGTATLSSWLYKITVNAALDKLRAMSRRQEMLSDTPVEELDYIEGDGSPYTRYAVRERYERTIRAMQQLPLEQREVVKLKAEEFTFEEIAEMLGIPLSTAKTRFYTAVEKLKMQVPA